MKYDERIKNYKTWTAWERPASTLKQSKGDGSLLRSIIKNKNLEYGFFVKAIMERAETTRKKIDDLAGLDPDERKEKRDWIIGEYVKYAEELKQARAQEILDSLEVTRQEYESGQIYQDIPGTMEREALALDRFRLQAGILKEDEAISRIGEARRTGMYNRDELLTLAQKSERSAELVRELMEAVPPHVANRGGRDALAELDQLKGAGIGRMPYKIKGSPTTASADIMNFLNTPIPADPSKQGPIDPAVMAQVFQTEKRNREEKQRAEDLAAIAEARAEIEAERDKVKRKRSEDSKGA